MDRTLEVVGLLLLCGIRLGIPIALTLLLAWALRRLDARWQAEADTRATLPEVKQAAVTKVHCWEMRHCPRQRRENCLAYAQPDIPCWDVFRANGHLREQCRDCLVFGRAVTLAGV